MKRSLNGLSDISLADIEIKIDKEYPFLTTIPFSSGKKKMQFIKSILALREKLYPNVLPPEQMELFKVILPKNREHLQKMNSQKKIRMECGTV